jgi:tRNA U34 5-methylaminomethyl-2-thiouridine-forming methyltransferase MnmC
MIRGEQTLPLHLFKAWAALTGGRNIARWVARQVNCHVAATRVKTGAEATVLSALERSTAALHSASKALEDGKVEASELADYRNAMVKAIEELEKLGSVLEQHRKKVNAGHQACSLYAAAKKKNQHLRDRDVG